MKSKYIAKDKTGIYLYSHKPEFDDASEIYMNMGEFMEISKK